MVSETAPEHNPEHNPEHGTEFVRNLQKAFDLPPLKPSEVEWFDELGLELDTELDTKTARRFWSYFKHPEHAVCDNPDIPDWVKGAIRT
jgi:hypothetical protein